MGGCTIQDWKSYPVRTRKETLRLQTERVWWSDQASLPQEGQNNQEDLPQAPMLQVQTYPTNRNQALQAFRVGRQKAQIQGTQLVGALGQHQAVCTVAVKPFGNVKRDNKARMGQP